MVQKAIPDISIERTDADAMSSRCTAAAALPLMGTIRPQCGVRLVPCLELAAAFSIFQMRCSPRAFPRAHPTPPQPMEE